MDKIQTSLDGTEYDITNFSLVMRECFVVMMNNVMKPQKDDKDFWRCQNGVMELRKAIDKFYRWQLDKWGADSYPLWVFGLVALRRLEEGSSVDIVINKFSFTSSRSSRYAMDNAKQIYNDYVESLDLEDAQ